MRFVGHEWRLLDAPLFWRKVIMLVVFFGAFIPLKLYERDLRFFGQGALDLYVAFLLLLHVYILIVFLYRIRWKVLAENRKPFAVRIVAIATFVLLLTVIKAGATVQELLLFVALSGLVHLALLLSLTVDVRPLAAHSVESNA